MEVISDFQISVVIPTLKRYVTLRKLINDLLIIGNVIQEIIVVDSTDENERQDLMHLKKVIQIKTSHKNGLYQRFLGSRLAKNDWVLFLDNDMELLDASLFNNLDDYLSIVGISGIAIKFIDKHQDTSLNSIPKSKFKKDSLFFKAKGFLTGYPVLPTGKYGYCGLRGRQPSTFSKTEWLSGGAFLAKKEMVFKLLNFQSLDLFEKKLGMGEDPLIGYMLSKQGDLYYYPILTFYHNDQKDSAYSIDLFNYGKRVVFSRLFLSLEKARLDNKSLILAHFYYHWHTVFRLFGLLISFFIERSDGNSQMFFGGIKGWLLTFKYNYVYSESDKIKWVAIANHDIDSFKTAQNN